MSDKRRWDIQDFGIATAENAVWMYCKHIWGRDQMEVGNTCYFDFQTGAGKDTLKVVRLSDHSDIPLCLDCCKLCSWAGAAKAYLTLSIEEKSQVMVELAKWKGERDGAWYIENLLAAVELSRI